MKKSIISLLIIMLMSSLLIGCSQNSSTSSIANASPISSTAPTTTLSSRKPLGITLKQFIDNYNKAHFVLLDYNKFTFDKTIDQNITQYRYDIMNNCISYFADCYSDKTLNFVAITINLNNLSDYLSTNKEQTNTTAVSFFQHFLYGVYPSFSTDACDDIFAQLLKSTPVKTDDGYYYYFSVSPIKLTLFYDPSENAYVLTATAAED